MTHPSPRIRRSKYSIDGILPGWTSQGDVEHTYMGEHAGPGAPKRCCHPLILQRDGILRDDAGKLIVPWYLTQPAFASSQADVWLDDLYCVEYGFHLVTQENLWIEEGKEPVTILEPQDCLTCPQCGFPSQIHALDRRRVTNAKRYEDRRKWLRVLCEPGVRVKALIQAAKVLTTPPRPEGLPSGAREVRV
jgi:hypothetical protein